MEGFDHILNWTLKVGSHPFPGKDGGTCINEAALVAAGFRYRPIRQAEEMPACFSRPICRLAMRLNDEATDEERQLLLPFVTKLACADKPEIERERTLYIGSRMKRHIGFRKGLEILKGALALGRHADLIPLDDAKARMDLIRGNDPTIVFVPGTPLLRKIKGWFVYKQTEPAT
jgi:hypothetical protein